MRHARRLNQIVRRSVLAGLVGFVVLSCTGDPLSYLQDKVLSDQAHELLSYSFPAGSNPALSVSVAGTISDSTVTVVVPVHTDVSTLIAEFEINGDHALVSSILQESGSTPNDFTQPVTLRVVAADASYIDYTVTVREAADNANLESLALTRMQAGSYLPYLEPVFSSDELNYAIWVPKAVDSVSVVAETVDPAATVSINGQSGTSTAESLVGGPNTVTVVVTAEDTTVIRTYTVEVYRAISIMYTGAILDSSDGEDGQSRLGYDWDPVTRFVDNGDGTISDLLTGLIWLKDWDALPNANWETALNNIEDIEDGSYGLTDGSLRGEWRMPNAFELFTLSHAASSVPGNWLQSYGFVDMEGNYDYLTSTTIKGSTDIFTVDLDSGWMQSYGKTQGTYRNVIAVRGAQADGLLRTQKTGQVQTYRSFELDDDGALEAGVPWPDPRFLDQGNGTILDRFTGLIWVKNWDVLPSTGNWSTSLSDVATLQDDGSLLTDGSQNGDWRLPNVREIATLVNYDYLGFNTWLESNGFENIPTGDRIRTSTRRGNVTDTCYAVIPDNQRIEALFITAQGRYTGVRDIE